MEITEKISIINAHRQLNPKTTCIPSAVEIVLKLYKCVNSNYYGQQTNWPGGTFAKYHDQSINGIIFKQNWTDQFKREKLVELFDKTISEGGYVIISIKNENEDTFHMWVIIEKSEENNFRAFSKNSSNTAILNNVLDSIGNSTDFLICSKKS